MGWQGTREIKKMGEEPKRKETGKERVSGQNWDLNKVKNTET